MMGGESRLKGHIYQLKSWDRWDDRRKLRFLRQMAERYGGDPAMRWWTVQNVLQPAGVEPMDNEGQARAMLEWVQTRIYYANETGEQIQSPWRTIKEGTGDCDDMALLLATMAHSVGLGFRFAIAGTDRQGRPLRWVEGERWKPGTYSHIYLQLGWPALNPSIWASAEPTLRGTPLGYDVVELAQNRSATVTEAPIRADLPGFGSPVVSLPHRGRFGDVAIEPAPLPVLGVSASELAREVMIGVIVSLGTTYAMSALVKRRR